MAGRVRAVDGADMLDHDAGSSAGVQEVYPGRVHRTRAGYVPARVLVLGLPSSDSDDLVLGLSLTSASAMPRPRTQSDLVSGPRTTSSVLYLLVY